MPKDLIEVKTIGCSGTVVINRPENQNALTRSMIGQLGEALDDLYREKSVRAIILTGAGDAFCSGVDLKELQSIDTPAAQKQWGEDASNFRDLLLHMLETPKPIIAAVNGPALSEGAGLVAACDLVVGAEEASIGVPDPQFGLVAGVVAPLLCHRLGRAHATRMLLTSAVLDAPEAERLGLFHELVKGDLVWARAAELAEQVATGAPEAIHLTKRLLNDMASEQLESQLSTGAIMRAMSCTTEAAQEGTTAFLEGREAEWK